jgi:hypothetical protein
MHLPVTLEEGINKEIFLKPQNTFRYEFKSNNFMELGSSADTSSKRLYLIMIRRLPYSSPSKKCLHYPELFILCKYYFIQAHHIWYDVLKQRLATSIPESVL